MELTDRLESLAATHAELTARLASPDLVADPRRFRDTSRALAEIDEVVALWRTYQAVARQVEQARELLADAATDPDLARLAADEAADGDRELEQLEGRLRLALVP